MANEDQTITTETDLLNQAEAMDRGETAVPEESSARNEEIAPPQVEEPVNPASEATAEEAAPAEPKDTKYTRAKKDAERLDKSWKKLEEEKAAVRAEAERLEKGTAALPAKGGFHRPGLRGSGKAVRGRRPGRTRPESTRGGHRGSRAGAAGSREDAPGALHDASGSAPPRRQSRRSPSLATRRASFPRRRATCWRGNKCSRWCLMVSGKRPKWRD